MKGDVDIEIGNPPGVNGGGITSFPGIKLPNDGKIGFFPLITKANVVETACRRVVLQEP